MPQHRHFSPEELRLNDYCHLRGRTPVSSWKDGVMRAFQGGGFVQPGAIRSRRQAVDLRKRTLGAEIIAFDVGRPEEAERISIHESIIKPKSPFVQMALSKEWKEAKERIIPLPDDDPEIFKIYQHWLYFGQIYCVYLFGQPKEYAVLAKASVLGDKLMDGDFKDAVIDCIVDALCKDQVFDVGLTNYVYEHTTATSPLRRLWQDIYMWAGNPTWLDENVIPEPLNGDFAVDLSRRQMEMAFVAAQSRPPAPSLQNICLFHGHGNGKCYRM
jgi:hypothetical protein